MRIQKVFKNGSAHVHSSKPEMLSSQPANIITVALFADAVSRKKSQKPPLALPNGIRHVDTSEQVPQGGGIFAQPKWKRHVHGPSPVLAQAMHVPSLLRRTLIS
ncbi:hypothetical protein Q5Y75_27825 [Ruegeria sp. 2205SS24-7]|uniref:hypothetical protein n=1 Tax=Ruegeria discodermiae TaxID=3064389 RepID=UPI00274084EF|nr:hypothetical protein [Ruegeria sp. 2205SS24-7]MDP5220995.1 hypothetical protein [Ruegeria sp. 2205SS24-7]